MREITKNKLLTHTEDYQSRICKELKTMIHIHCPSCFSYILDLQTLWLESLELRSQRD